MSGIFNSNIKKLGDEIRAWFQFSIGGDCETTRSMRDDFIEHEIPRLMPKLKPLVWVQIAPDHAWAVTPFGTYNVTQDVVCCECGNILNDACDSMDHGKQLCHADFERRVAELFE